MTALHGPFLTVSPEGHRTWVYRRTMPRITDDAIDIAVYLYPSEADATAGGKAEHDEQQQKKIRESVDSLLSQVSEADRILLILKEVEGLSLKELEKVYRVSENALKVRLFRARQRVLKAFESAEKREGTG